MSTMDDLPQIAQSQIDLLVENLNVQYKDLSQADKLQTAIDLVIEALRNGDRVDQRLYALHEWLIRQGIEEPLKLTQHIDVASWQSHIANYRRTEARKGAHTAKIESYIQTSLQNLLDESLSKTALESLNSLAALWRRSFPDEEVYDLKRRIEATRSTRTQKQYTKGLFDDVKNAIGGEVGLQASPKGAAITKRSKRRQTVQRQRTPSSEPSPSVEICRGPCNDFDLSTDSFDINLMGDIPSPLRANSNIFVEDESPTLLYEEPMAHIQTHDTPLFQQPSPSSSILSTSPIVLVHHQNQQSSIPTLHTSPETHCQSAPISILEGQRQGSQDSGYSTQEAEANNEGDLGTQGDGEGGLDTQFNSIGEANSEGDLSTQGGVNDEVDLQVLEYSVSPPRCESQHESSPSGQSSELDELGVYTLEDMLEDFQPGITTFLGKYTNILREKSKGAVERLQWEIVLGVQKRTTEPAKGFLEAALHINAAWKVDFQHVYPETLSGKINASSFYKRKREEEVREQQIYDDMRTKEAEMKTRLSCAEQLMSYLKSGSELAQQIEQDQDQEFESVQKILAEEQQCLSTIRNPAFARHPSFVTELEDSVEGYVADIEHLKLAKADVTALQLSLGKAMTTAKAIHDVLTTELKRIQELFRNAEEEAEKYEADHECFVRNRKRLFRGVQ